MCGITGLIETHGNLSTESMRAAVVRMMHALTHRGPDDSGLFVDESSRVVLGHRRLSVIDPSPAGAQPMTTPDGRFTLVYNGEIYNADELAALIPGFTPMGHCDSEIILHLLAARGSEAIGRLNGMFALALYDRERREILLARDRFGQKPLYYMSGQGRFAFASELRALMHVPGYSSEIDSEALGEYLLLQYVPPPRTIHRGTRQLPPGCWMRVSVAENDITPAPPVRYFDWQPGHPPRLAASRSRSLSFPDLVNQADQLINEAVKKRMVSDVPLGAMLSGGVDSALIVAAMKRHTTQPVKTFSIGFAGSDESEHVQARATAKILGTDHYEEIIEPNVMALLPTIAEALDAPLGDSSCLPTWCLARLVRQHVTVALSGDGGDELFGGYARYTDTLREANNRLWQWRYRFRHKEKWTPAQGYCSPRWWMLMPDDIARFLGTMPDETKRTANWMRAMVNNRTRPLIHRMRALDAQTYLPGAVLAKVDRMTMAHSLEARSPFLDSDVAAFAEMLPPEACIGKQLETKRLLRAVLARSLPREIVTRPKRGFGLPSAGWSQREMIDLAREIILASDSRTGHVMDRHALTQWVEDQANPSVFSVYQMWTLLILELWLRSSEGEEGLKGEVGEVGEVGSSDHSVSSPIVHVTPMSEPGGVSLPSCTLPRSPSPE